MRRPELHVLVARLMMVESDEYAFFDDRAMTAKESIAAGLNPAARLQRAAERYDQADALHLQVERACGAKQSNRIHKQVTRYLEGGPWPKCS